MLSSRVFLVLCLFSTVRLCVNWKVFGLPKRGSISWLPGMWMSLVTTINWSTLRKTNTGYAQLSEHTRRGHPDPQTVRSIASLHSARDFHRSIRYGGCEDVSIYKFDILSQRGLGKIGDALQLIRENQPELGPGHPRHPPVQEDPGSRNASRQAGPSGVSMWSRLQCVY